MTGKKKFDPSKMTSRWDPRNEFDVVAVGVDNAIVWRDYGDPPRHVITRKGENPRDVAARDREKNEQRERERRRSATR